MSLRERQETMRRRNLSESDLRREDKESGKYKKDLKSDYRYMQKYYGSLAFFQDEDEALYKRDYNIATGYDMMDKTHLPEFYRKRGGEMHRKGKGKFKDLMSEDTNNYDPYYAYDQKIFDKMRKRQAGYKRVK